MKISIPTQPITANEFARWSRVYDSDDYVYGLEAGSVARRAVRYHRSRMPQGGTALDLGCGEGQDTAYLAGAGYDITGVEFIPSALAKARRLASEQGVAANFVSCDLLAYHPCGEFNLVLASNSLQFLGEQAVPCLQRCRDAVAPGGVIALSVFGCDGREADVNGSVCQMPLAFLARFFEAWLPLEAAQVWQWDSKGNRAQLFCTYIACNMTSNGPNILCR